MARKATPNMKEAIDALDADADDSIRSASGFLLGLLIANDSRPMPVAELGEQLRNG